MSNKPNLGSAESLRRNPNELRPYICSICSKGFATSQALAGHHNAHRPWYSHYSRWRHTEEENNATNADAAEAEADEDQRPLSPDPISYLLPANDEQPISRPFYSFMQTEPCDRTPVDPAPETEPRSCLGLDQVGGTSTGCSSYDENPKKRKLGELIPNTDSTLETESADECRLKL